MIRYHNIIILSSAILISACGGGSTDDIDTDNPNNLDNLYQPDTSKPIGNDGSEYPANPANPYYQPIKPTSNPSNPNMTIPTPVLSLPADRRI